MRTGGGRELTEREHEVLSLMDRGLTNEEIAGQLGISVPGVKYHVSQILSKLGVASRREVGSRRNWFGIAWRAALGLAATAVIIGLVVLGIGALLADNEGDDNAVAVPTATSSEPTDETITPTFTVPPSPIFTVAPGPAPEGQNPSAYELYYFVDEDVFVVEPGGRPRLVASVKGCNAVLYWSPNGERVVCTGPATVLLDSEFNELRRWEVHGIPEWSPTGDALSLFIDEQLFLIHRDGTQLADLGLTDLAPGGIVTPGRGDRWSPDGDELAYWDDEDAQLRIYSVTAASDRPIAGDFRPLAWLTNESLLAARGYVRPTDDSVSLYEVHTINVNSEETTHFAELAPSFEGQVGTRVQAWLSPDGTRAAVLTRREDGRTGLAIADMQIGHLTGIPDATVTYPSHFIPTAHIHWSADGEILYWINPLDPAISLYRVATEQVERITLTELGYHGKISPDGRAVAYGTNDFVGGSSMLSIALLDGSEPQHLDRWPDPYHSVNYAFFWRPVPVEG